MIENFSGYSRSSIEFLISTPSIAMTVMKALSSFISRVLSDRLTIVVGLIVAGIGGIMPFFAEYTVVLVVRIIIGTGFGLINTRAISIIGERFTGEQRAKLLG